MPEPEAAEPSTGKFAGKFAGHSTTRRGWLYVAAQVILLGALIVLPNRSDWPVADWLRLLSNILFFGGLALVALAALGLGPSLTPTPVPKETGQLVTAGFYRWVRHPIYSGVLALVVGMTLRSGSWISLVVAAITVAFFNNKAAWEEQQLAARYPSYPAYAERTPRFVPKPGRRA